MGGGSHLDGGIFDFCGRGGVSKRRDALVRAMHRNVVAGVMPDDSFPVAFCENALGFAENE